MGQVAIGSNQDDVLGGCCPDGLRLHGTRVSVRVSDDLVAALLAPALIGLGCRIDDAVPDIIVSDVAHSGTACVIIGGNEDATDSSRTVPNDRSAWMHIVCALHELKREAPDQMEGVNAPEKLRAGLLTARQTEILQLVADGLSTQQAARRIGISAKTVNNHLGAVYARLDALNLTQAVLEGARRGLVQLR